MGYVKPVGFDSKPIEVFFDFIFKAFEVLFHIKKWGMLPDGIPFLITINRRFSQHK